LPVTTPGLYPRKREYSSKNHAISLAPVFMSGAGMSSMGPMISLMAPTNFRVTFSSSRSLSFFGSTVTPPLAPPKGKSITAVFQVMSDARERTSSRSTCGW
jgi:hypothetical protein